MSLVMFVEVELDVIINVWVIYGLAYLCVFV